MSWYRWLSCAALLGVVDAAWLYLLLGLLGFVAGIGHAPLSWLVVTTVLVIGVLSQAVHELVPANWRMRALLLPFVSILVGWLAVGSASGFHAVSLGFAWPLQLLTGDVESSRQAFFPVLATHVSASPPVCVGRFSRQKCQWPLW